MTHLIPRRAAAPRPCVGRATRRIAGLAWCTGLLALVACGSDSSSTAPPTPTAATFSVMSGEEQVGTVGAALSSPIVLEVLDQSGSPVADVAVGWTASGGGSAVAAQ